MTGGEAWDWLGTAFKLLAELLLLFVANGLNLALVPMAAALPAKGLLFKAFAANGLLFTPPLAKNGLPAYGATATGLVSCGDVKAFTWSTDTGDD